MNPPVFLDTSFIVALVNTRDEWHESALRWQRRITSDRTRRVTTELVLIEIGDALAAIPNRTIAARVIEVLRASPWIDVVPASTELFETAFVLFHERLDKDWGLTDCVSFTVVKRCGITDALTVDRHFQQAGFRALLLEP